MPIASKRKTYRTDSVHDLEGPVEDVIKRLKEGKKDGKKQGYTDIRIDIIDQWGYYDDHWVDVAYSGIKQLTVEQFLKEKR